MTLNGQIISQIVLYKDINISKIKELTDISRLNNSIYLPTDVWKQVPPHLRDSIGHFKAN
jgi:hypothetical protein